MNLLTDEYLAHSSAWLKGCADIIGMLSWFYGETDVAVTVANSVDGHNKANILLAELCEKHLLMPSEFAAWLKETRISPDAHLRRIPLSCFWDNDKVMSGGASPASFTPNFMVNADSTLISGTKKGYASSFEVETNPYLKGVFGRS